ncbi:uncharacterized protein PFB0765w-like isoform X1 [Cephus cinctus]|uniref:Uncharacterized protein PFB0765w-like isoform X1 n=1 Tax=Cephus cinctus TaxID=211228 RepID=A0AAJ7VZN5_CEPCN|nr:uncharacterized protein PFB0765w-like isoform X1 [Cephus cinctus]
MLTFLKHAKRLEHHYLIKGPPNSRTRKSFVHDDTSKGVNDEIKSVQEILRKVKLKTESKMHHVNKMFSKATENVNDAIKKSNKILSEKLDRNEKVVSDIMKKVTSQSTQLKDCIDKYKGDVYNARNDFSHEIKDCNKNAIIALEGIKSNCEVPIKEAQEFKANVKHLLKQCLQTKGATTKCLTDKMNEMVTRYNEIFEKLNEIPKNTDSLVLKNIKDMTDCHQEAHRKLQKNLQEIVEKTEKCVSTIKARFST